MAQKSSTMGLVADAIQKLPAECRPDNSIIQKLLVKKVSLMKMHQKHNLVIRHLMALLDRLGVKGVLLKGQSMALNYAVSESRNVGDIDVYVGAEVMEVRPGITSLASIRYRHENDVLAQAEDPDRCYVEVVMPDKLAIDVEYVERQGFFYDLRIIFATLAAIFH